MTTPPNIGIRWTIGNVSARGFEALRLSIWGAWRIFGPESVYTVCVNTIDVDRARQQTGGVPGPVMWHDATRALPRFLAEVLDPSMAEGVGWKLAPLRCFPDHYEISLDNDCILWSLPTAMQQWFEAGNIGQCLMAEDVRACFGVLSDLCGPQPRNAGIRGLPPGFDFEVALRKVLHRQGYGRTAPLKMTSELDEQGLQTAALSLTSPPLAVALSDVTICSPFYPHLQHLGRCGAHFVGLNARHIPWKYYDRPADDWMTDHWNQHRRVLYEKVGLPPTAEAIA
ncbi:MAG TPA: hypothetical protein VHP11_11865 [Tepidisphaeraceae bacterium]|nr:hypothetical protein [Tepidisphaeraceae bacterium]